MVVAIAALIVAMSGTAVAASTLVNGDKLIKKNSLSGNRLRNGSVAGGKINLSSLGTVPNAAHANNADSASIATNATNATNASNATTAGSAAIAKVTYVTATTSVPGNSGAVPSLVTATCPTGTTVVGGGASVADEVHGFVNDSYPNGRTGWAADIFDSSNSGSMSTTVTAICAPAASTAP